MIDSDKYPVVIAGAGPAGLTAAYQLAQVGRSPLVLERDRCVGGIARTEKYKGYRFDIGGHRFYTKVPQVQDFWMEILGDDFIKVPRLSRIYYQGKFFSYPLSIANTLQNLGIITSGHALLSYLKAKVKARLHPVDEPDNFEDWAIDRFGKQLYLTFFKTYTEKVWGIPCSKIHSEWASQRIQGLSLKRAIINALFGTNNTKTLIKEFDYPILGPGMMWECVQDKINNLGGKVQLETKVITVHHQSDRITGVTMHSETGIEYVDTEHFISTMPISLLIEQLDPPAPEPVITAARSLKYRAFLIVSLIVDAADLFPDNWIYVHSPEVKVGRIQNFKNWSAAMVPDSTKTCLGMEYFCNEGDEIWSMTQSELVTLATREIAQLGLADPSDVIDGVVIRQPKAYPVYDGVYRQHLEVIQSFLSQFQNLHTVGRNGMHRYNNQDHSMLTAMLAVENIMGKNHDVWNVNTERSYYETFTKEEWNRVRDDQLNVQSIPSSNSN
jgi:protoporphyrinogen oxidase